MKGLISILLGCCLAIISLPLYAQKDVISAKMDEHALATEQTLRIRIPGDYAVFDPNLAVDAYAFDAMRDLFEGLYSQNAVGDVVPGVALSHQVEAGGRRYVFQLRLDAKWSDGTLVTAHDFVYSWQRVVDPATKAPYSWFFTVMKVKNFERIINGELPPSELGIYANGDHELVVELEKDIPFFDRLVTQPITFPVPHQHVTRKGAGWSKESLISNGAFKLDHYAPDRLIVRVKNSHYWNNNATIIERVEEHVVRDDQKAYLLFKAGQFDFNARIPPQALKEHKAQNRSDVLQINQLCNYFLAFNMSQNAPQALRDARVRKALSYAIDREFLVRAGVSLSFVPAYHFTPNSVKNFTAPLIPYALMSQKERDAAAQALLLEAGYGPGGKVLEFEFMFNLGATHERLARLITQMWRQKLGVKADLKPKEWKGFLNKFISQDYDVARNGWCAEYNEASAFLNLFDASGHDNFTEFTNERVKTLLDQAAASGNGAQEYQEIELILAQEMPVIPLFHSANHMLKSQWLRGMPDQNPEFLWYSKDLFFVKKS